MTGTTATNLCVWSCYPDYIKSNNAQPGPPMNDEPNTITGALFDGEFNIQSQEKTKTTELENKKKPDSGQLRKSRDASARTRPPWGSHLKPVKVVAPRIASRSTSRPRTASTGCRLQDLCTEDRSKLARLVYELAIAKEAHGADVFEPSCERVTLEKPKEDNFVKLEEVPNQEGNTSARSIPSQLPESSECTKPVFCDYKELTQNFDQYRVELTRLEEELRRLRCRLPGNTQSNPQFTTPDSQVKSNLPQATERRDTVIENSTSEKERLIASKAVQVHDQNPDPSTFDEPQVISPKKEIQEELMKERIALQRQHKLLSIVAEQQAKLQQLNSKVQQLSSMVIESESSMRKTRVTEDVPRHDRTVTSTDPPINRVSQPQVLLHNYTSTLLPTEHPKSDLEPQFDTHRLGTYRDLPQCQNSELYNPETVQLRFEKMLAHAKDISTQTNAEQHNNNSQNVGFVTSTTQSQVQRPVLCISESMLQYHPLSTSLNSVTTQTSNGSTRYRALSPKTNDHKVSRTPRHLKAKDDSIRRHKRVKRTSENSHPRSSKKKAVQTPVGEDKQSSVTQGVSNLHGRAVERDLIQPNDMIEPTIPLKSTRLTLTSESLEEIQSVLSILSTLDSPTYETSRSTVLSGSDQPPSSFSLRTTVSSRFSFYSSESVVEDLKAPCRTSITMDAEENQLLHDLFFCC